MCRAREDSKIIPGRLVLCVCVMYNPCAEVCNKQQGGSLWWLLVVALQGASGHQHQDKFSSQCRSLSSLVTISGARFD